MKITTSIFLGLSFLLTTSLVNAQNELTVNTSTSAPAKQEMRNVVSFVSAYTTSVGTMPGDENIPLPKMAFPVQGTDITVDAGGSAFTLNTQGFYEITYGVSSLSGGRLAIMIMPGSAIPGIIAQSKMTLDASTSRRMTTTSFIYYNVSPSIPTMLALVPYGIANFSLDAISGDVTAFITIKKLG